MNGLRDGTRNRSAGDRRTEVGLAPAAAVLALLFLSIAAGTVYAEPLSLTLSDAVDIALENNREIAMAEAGLDAARARLGQARAGYFPALTASGSYTRLDEAPYMDASQFGDFFAPLMTPFEYLVDEGYLDPATLVGLQSDGADKIYLGDDDIYSVGLTVTQPLFTGGAILSAHGAARHAARAEEFNASRTEERVRYDATRAYLGLVQADAALATMDDATGEMTSHLSDLEAMYEEGMIIEADLMRARVQMSEVELARNRARHGVELARAGLGFVLGLGPEVDVVPLDGLEMDAASERGLPAWTELALERRADLRSMGELVGAADNGVSLARSAYFPSVVAVGTYAWDRPDREYQPEFYEHWSITLAVEMNIFDWGLTRNRVREARAGLTQVERGYEMMSDAVRLEVRQAYLEREEALDAAAIAENGLAQARESMRVVRESFRSGLATNSDVLSAQTALTTAMMNRIGALARLTLAEAGLELAAGVAGAGEETR
ncbi:MAG: TolC family protein [Candidatus Eisenbacteria bacterium]